MKQILVVDDDRMSLDLMAAVLEHTGVPLIPIIKSSEALEAIYMRGDQIGLMLLDLSMPGLNGFEICRLVRSDPRLAQLPIVAVTANATEDTIARALNAGFNRVIFKPFHPQQIYDLLVDYHITDK